VPIVLAYLDYGRKAGGFGPVIETTGDIESDIENIRKFYHGITPKYPRNVGMVVTKSQASTQNAETIHIKTSNLDMCNAPHRFLGFFCKKLSFFSNIRRL
jgi:hypothetical protein